jgi:hypothetical protein
MTPSDHIDARIKELGDWRGDVLARVRNIITQADPAIAEAWKWRGVPVWECGGIICTGESYKAVVNASLEGNTRRAIDIRDGDVIDEAALKALVVAAVQLNMKKKR